MSLVTFFLSSSSFFFFFFFFFFFLNFSPLLFPQTCSTFDLGSLSFGRIPRRTESVRALAQLRRCALPSALTA